MKLEKVEIGGIRGKALTSNIGKVYEEFKVKPFLMKARFLFQRDNTSMIRIPINDTFTNETS